MDDTTAEAVIEMIVEYARRENKTLVMVTHSKAIAQRFSDKIIEIAYGKAVGGQHERNN